MLSSTVSQGKTEFSWKMKMCRGSGSVTLWPSIWISPCVAARKPPAMLSRVDLPQPEGPTRQTNSPSPTSRLMSSRTWVVVFALSFPVKVIQTSRTVIFERMLRFPLECSPLRLLIGFPSNNR